MAGKEHGDFLGDRLWVVHIGLSDQIALRAHREGFVCIGWSKMGDLSQLKTREALRDAMRRTWPAWSEGKVNSSYGQAFRFAHEMQVGEAIVFPVRPLREVAIGRISGEYRWAADDQALVDAGYCNVRPVQWLKTVPRTTFTQATLHSFGSSLSVSTSDDCLEEVSRVLRGGTGRPAPVPPTAAAPPASDDDAESESTYDLAREETEDYLLREWQRSGFEFEKVVAAVLEAIGYHATVTPRSGDHGVDVIAHPDPLGLQKPFIKVQAKSGTGSVGEPVVNQLKGCLNPGEQGIVVSLGKFTPQAEAAARAGGNIMLVDGKKFVELFLDHYERLDQTWQIRFRLRQVFVPVR